MSKNINYYKSLQGKLKIVSLILALISTSLGYYCFFGSELKHTSTTENSFTVVEHDLGWKEIYFLTATSLCLIIGIIEFVIHECSLAIIFDRRTGHYDFGFHAVSLLLLLSSGFLLATSAVEYHDDGCTPEVGCQLFTAKLLTALLTLITGVSYGAVGVVVYTHRRDLEK